jgi:hypothetical protein
MGTMRRPKDAERDEGTAGRRPECCATRELTAPPRPADQDHDCRRSSKTSQPTIRPSGH